MQERTAHSKIASTWSGVVQSLQNVVNTPPCQHVFAHLWLIGRNEKERQTELVLFSKLIAWICMTWLWMPCWFSPSSKVINTLQCRGKHNDLGNSSWSRLRLRLLHAVRLSQTAKFQSRLWSLSHVSATKFQICAVDSFAELSLCSLTLFHTLLC